MDNLSEALGSDVVEPKRRLGQGAEVSSRCGGEGDTGNGESRHRGVYLTRVSSRIVHQVSHSLQVAL